MSAEELKDEGNKLFAAKEWLKAASKYTQVSFKIAAVVCVQQRTCVCVRAT
jgi:hypothetical protein